MAKKFRLRNLFASHPVLDGLRLKLLAGICHHGTRFFDNSYRVTKVISPAARPYIDGEKPALFALYHGRMVGMLQLVPRHKVTVLVSRSRDGEIIARALKALGYMLARGSPAHKAIAGTMQMVRAAQSGQHLAVMADGPRGPVYTVKPGVVRLAELTGLPIVPFVCSARSAWWFWGWDNFMGPLWASPIVYLVGDPVHVPAEAGDSEREQLRQELELRMNHMRDMAEQYWHVTGGRRESLNFSRSN
jgi:hypothetical protein